jgi:hypothetical protein
MSRSSEMQLRRTWCVGAILIGMVALGCTAQALAYEPDQPASSVTLGAPGKKPSDEAKPAAASGQDPEQRPLPTPAKSPKGAPRSLFRCWQEGELIFEGAGYGPLPPAQIAAELKAADGGTGKVQVLDLYQGVCILEVAK